MANENTIVPAVSADKVETKCGDWIREGWNLVKANLGFSILAVLVYLVIYSILYVIPLLGPLASLLIAGTLEAGFFYFFFEIIRGRGAKIENLFEPFKKFVPTMLAGLVKNAFILLGTAIVMIPIILLSFLIPVVGIFSIIAIVPAIFLATIYMFTLPLVIEQNLSFWEAMETSRKTVMKNLQGFIIFNVVACILMQAGALACFIGLFITVPIGVASFACAYKNVFGLKS